MQRVWPGFLLLIAGAIACWGVACDPIAAQGGADPGGCWKVTETVIGEALHGLDSGTLELAPVGTVFRGAAVWSQPESHPMDSVEGKVSGLPVPQPNEGWTAAPKTEAGGNSDCPWRNSALA